MRAVVFHQRDRRDLVRHGHQRAADVAELEDRRERALSERQLDLNSRGIAVPLRGRHGELVGALDITLPMGHEGSEEAATRVLPVLRETAQAMRSLI